MSDFLSSCLNPASVATSSSENRDSGASRAPQRASPRGRLGALLVEEFDNEPFEPRGVNILDVLRRQEVQACHVSGRRDRLHWDPVSKADKAPQQQALAGVELADNPDLDRARGLFLGLESETLDLLDLC